MHIIKNEKPLKDIIIIKLIAIFLSLIVSSIFIIFVTGLNPIEIFQSAFNGTFGSFNRLNNVLRDTAFLWLISIGLAPSFKMKFWNNGAEGQILIGSLISAGIMINFSDIFPNYVLLILMFIFSFIGGALWGFIPAYFKAKYKTNEVLFTLMMNYIAIQIVEFCVDLWDKKKSHVIGIINSSSNKGWFPTLFGNKYSIVFIIVILFAIFMHIYLNYTKHGYEIEVVGESANTAKYAGINVNKVLIRTVVLSSGISAIAGFINVCGMSHTVSAATAGGKGFTAIIVAWLSNFNIGVMGLFSFLLQFLSKGAIQISSQFNLNDYASDIVIGIIIFFIIGAEFFTRYKIMFNKKEGK